MSIKKVDMYTVVCDNCGVESGKGEAIVAWTESDHAVNEAIDSFGWIEVDPCKIVPNCEKHYCPNCIEWNEDESELIPKEGIDAS